MAPGRAYDDDAIADELKRAAGRLYDDIEAAGYLSVNTEEVIVRLLAELHGR